MDKLDLMIAALLQEDATATNSQIARKVGVSEETVRRRLRRLAAADMIKTVAVPNADKLGFGSLVMVGIKVDVDKVDDVAAELTGMAQVTRLVVTTGSYDMFAWANLQSTDNLSDFLRLGIGKIPGVNRMETFIVLSVEKEKYGVSMQSILDERFPADAD